MNTRLFSALLLLCACDVPCEDVSLSVSLTPGGPADLTVVGEVCSAGGFEGEDIEVLLHGATGNHTYWSGFDYSPFYSEVHSAALHGRSTFAYDAIGAGESSMPDGLTVGLEESAWVAAQVIEAVRAGELGHDFDKVALIGHSSASMVAIAAAAQVDVDALVLAGFSHQYTQAMQDSLVLLYPAMFDPKFAGTVTDPNYFTSQPGVREGWIYNAGLTDPGFLVVDEAEKDVFPLALGMDFAAAAGTDSLGVDPSTPVYMMLGSEDRAFCGEAVDCSDPASYAAHEAGFWSMPVQTELLEHFSIGLHFQVNSPIVFAKTGAFLDANL